MRVDIDHLRRSVRWGLSPEATRDIADELVALRALAEATREIPEFWEREVGVYASPRLQQIMKDTIAAIRAVVALGDEAT